MLKNKLLLILITLFITTIIFPQDSTQVKPEKWKWHWEELSDIFDSSQKHPGISFIAGLSDIKRKDMKSELADNLQMELRLGYSTQKISDYSGNITRYKFRYFYILKNSTNLAGGKDKPQQINTNNWRFGYGESGGYGYKLGIESAITTYFTYSLDWTRMDFIDSASTPEDRNIFELYDESIRFGNGNEAGIKFQPVNFLVFDAGYERSQVFQRHLFWKWAGSSVIEAVSHGIVDAFINEIMKSSPQAGPVVFLVLKSALAYGIYELRTDKMNWPFKSAKPVTFNTFKFGVTFVF